MNAQAGKLQPDGQSYQEKALGRRSIVSRFYPAWLVLAVLLLILPFNRGGFSDPGELRLAELGRRLASQLFGTDSSLFAGEQLAVVTRSQIGQGELSATSPALGFALFGVSDWAGRLTSLGWGVISLGALWVVMGRLTNRIAQVFSVLMLAALPVFAWQSRTLLGDAATIGTLTLATAALLAFENQLSARDASGSLSRAILWGAVALLALVAGVLARGVLVGVTVPALSVGAVGLLTRARAVPGTSRAARTLGWILLVFGSGAAIIGVYEIVVAPQGFSFWLGATLTGKSSSNTFAQGLSVLLHQSFPLIAFVPVAAVVATERASARMGTLDAERRVALCLSFTVLLSMVSVQLMSTRGVAIAFPALAPMAGISGLAIARLQRTSSLSATFAAMTTLTVAIILCADFVNVPDNVMLMTGVASARFPEGFRLSSQAWLGVATAVLGLGCVPPLLVRAAVRPTCEPLRARYLDVFARLRAAFSGQLLSGFVLVETALVTTALLQRTHDQGWIVVPVFDSVRAIFGSLVSWAWLAPPVALFVVPALFTTLQILSEKLIAFVERPKVRDRTPVRRRKALGLVFGAAMVLAELIVSIGHAPALAEHLSPKSAIRQYEKHARAGEPVALLGLKREASGYYLGALPQSFGDIEAAAKWLASGGTQRRWVIFDSERLAELNAAYRASTRGKNLVLLDAPTSNVVVATDRQNAGEPNSNPLAKDVLERVPDTPHHAEIEFGRAVRLVGWNIVNDVGSSVSMLHAGKSYELRLVFEVFATTAIDWQIFVHLDGRGRRHNGDHEPVAGRYPTTLWQPGDVVIDRHQLVLDRGSLPGPHSLYFGLFRGSRRFEVTKGNHDDNRVKLGDLELR